MNNYRRHYLLYLIISLISPPFGIPLGLIGLYSDFKRWRIYIFCITISLATYAFCYVPGDQTDLIRYFQFMDSVRDKPIEAAWLYSFFGDDNLVVFATIIWLISQTGINHLLPALSTSVIYFICFYITCKSSELKKIPSKYASLYILLALLFIPFYSVVNNIRNVLSFSLLGYAFFLNFYITKKKIWQIILMYACYILPIFIHSSAITVLAVRLLLPFIKRQKLLFLIVFLGVKETLVNNIGIIEGLPSGNIIFDMVKDALIKAYFYFTDEDSDYGLIVSRSGSMLLQKILNIAYACILAGVIMFLGKKRIVNKYFKEKEYDYMLCVYIYTVLAMSAVTIITGMYWRFTASMFVIAGPVFISCLNCKEFKIKTPFVILSSLLSLMIMILWFRNLFKDELEKLIIDPFFNSPILWPLL